MRRTKGSITIFSLLSLIVVTAVIFSLLEGTRYQELQRFAGMQTELALEGVFSNYNLHLWENYHLLGAEAGDMEDILKSVANGRTGSDRNLLSFQLEGYRIEAVSRLTDGRGMEYIHAITAYMQDHLLYEMAKDIYNQYEGVKSLLNQEKVDLSQIEKSMQEIENVRQTESEGNIESSPKSMRIASNEMTREAKKKKSLEADTLLDAVQQWRKNGVLELVVQDTSQLSDVQPDLSDDIFARRLQERTSGVDGKVSWMEQVFLQQYVLTYMSNYLNKQSGGAFSYEVEYLIGKKGSDKENLQAVVSKLFLIREVSNFMFLVSNPVKMAEAEAMALAVGGTTLNPVVVEIIKTGLLIAWALAESVLDVRALLAGKRIPLIKSEQNWTLELESIGMVAEGFPMAKESKAGIGYENYLGILLLLEEETDVAMYAMNAQEASIRGLGETSFHMDDMVTQAHVRIDYSYAPVFPFSQVLSVKSPWKNRISTTGSYGYY